MKKMIMVIMTMVILVMNMVPANAMAFEEINDEKAKVTAWLTGEIAEEVNDFIKYRRTMDDTFCVTAIGIRFETTGYQKVGRPYIHVDYIGASDGYDVVYGTHYFYW